MTDNPSPQALAPVAERGFSLAPRSLDEALKIADLVARSELVPTDYRGKPANVLIAMQMGMELGLPPLQAIQNIAVVNGRATIWGDLLPALARGCPGFEYLTESFDEDTYTWTCRGKRKNQPEEARSFSKEDAIRAGLWDERQKVKRKNRNTGEWYDADNDSPWFKYPKRMVQMRARSYLIRDLFPDALRGLGVREDFDAIDVAAADYSDVTDVAQSGGKPSVTMPKEKTEPAAKSEKSAASARGKSKPAAAGKSKDEDKGGDEAPAAPIAEDGATLTPGMIKTAQGRLSSSGKTELELFGAFGVDAWEELPRSKINDVLAWIAS